MLADRTLTLPNGLELLGPQVFQIVAAYRQENAAVIDLYDSTNVGAHDEVLPIDVLAMNALNSFGKQNPATPMTNIWVAREKISEVVTPISKSNCEMLDDSEIERQIGLIQEALCRIADARNVGDVSASKLLHRMRPGLVPIHDSQVRKWYAELPKSVSWATLLKCVYSWLRRPGNTACLLEIQAGLDVDLSVVRIWDVILWQLSWTHVATAE